MFKCFPVTHCGDFKKREKETYRIFPFESWDWNVKAFLSLASNLIVQMLGREGGGFWLAAVVGWAPAGGEMWNMDVTFHNAWAPFHQSFWNPEQELDISPSGANRCVMCREIHEWAYQSSAGRQLPVRYCSWNVGHNQIEIRSYM